MRTEHTSLQWHHNEHDGVPSNRRLDFTQPFFQVQIKENITSLAFVRGIHRGPVNSPHREPVTRKMFLFGDAIMCVQIKYIYIYQIKFCTQKRQPRPQSYERTMMTIKWKHFLRFWPFVRGIHRSPANSAHRGQWRGALMFSLICAWTNSWANNRGASDLRRHRAH